MRNNIFTTLLYALALSNSVMFAGWPIGWVGEAQPVPNNPSALLITGGWTLDPDHPCQSTRAFVEILEIDQGGVIGAVLASGWVNPTVHRPDVNSIYCRNSPVKHGFDFQAAVPKRAGYYVRARGAGLDAGDPNWWLLGDHRFARESVGNRVVVLRHRGPVTGLVRNNIEESYPTVMLDDDGVYKMWFTGGPADKIYYAKNNTGDPFNGAGWKSDWTVVVNESPIVPGTTEKLDTGLVADPSVVKADGTYFMMYTGIPTWMGCNRIFGAVSTDGVRWVKMNGDTRAVDNNPAPLIYPNVCTGYGAGQSSLIFGDNLPVGSYRVGHGFVQFHTDTSSPGGGALARTSEDGGWWWPLRSNLMMSAPPLGDASWDFKYVTWSGQYFGAVAIPGEIEGDGKRHGFIGLTVGDGANFSAQVRVPMKVLNPNANQQCINNGGLLGNSRGMITGNKTGFYFGAGYLMNYDQAPRPPHWDWDLHAVDVRIY